MPFALFNRFIRGTVGPLFINIALMMTVSTFVVVDLLSFVSWDVARRPYQGSIR
jgi:hypothetical protein